MTPRQRRSDGSCGPTAAVGGGLGAVAGHPLATYEGLALLRRPGGFDAAEIQRVRTSRLVDNDAYHIIDTADDLEKKWPLILDGRPDFLKIYLLYSEDYEERRARAGGESLAA